MEINVIVIIWRNGVAFYTLMAIVCSCDWMGMTLKTKISLTYYPLVMSYGNIEFGQHLLRLWLDKLQQFSLENRDILCGTNFKLCMILLLWNASERIIFFYNFDISELKYLYSIPWIQENNALYRTSHIEASTNFKHISSTDITRKSR